MSQNMSEPYCQLLLWSWPTMTHFRKASHIGRTPGHGGAGPSPANSTSCFSAGPSGWLLAPGCATCAGQPRWGCHLTGLVSNRSCRMIEITEWRMLMQVGCEQGRLFFHDSEGKIEVSKLRPANLKHKASKPYVSWESWNRLLSYPAVPLKTHLPTLHPGCLCCYACGSLPGPAYRHHVISRPWLSRFSQPLQVRIIWLLSYIFIYHICWLYIWAKMNITFIPFLTSRLTSCFPSSGQQLGCSPVCVLACLAVLCLCSISICLTALFKPKISLFGSPAPWSGNLVSCASQCWDEYEVIMNTHPLIERLQAFGALLETIDPSGLPQRNKEISWRSFWQLAIAKRILITWMI